MPDDMKEKAMQITRVYRHEDNGDEAKVFYNIFLSDFFQEAPKSNIEFDADGNRVESASVIDIEHKSAPRKDVKLHFVIEKMENEIYRDSRYEKILVPPKVIKMVFNKKETVKLMSLFVEASSIYMSAVRKALYSKNSLKMAIELKESGIKVVFNAIDKRYNTKGKGVNSARLIMGIYDLASGEELISIKLKKTKVMILMQIIKSLHDEYVRKHSLVVKNMNNENLSLVRVGDSVVIGNTWIHGREIQKFQDYIERVIFDFKFSVRYGGELFNYRQISAEFSNIENVAQINIVKFTSKHKVFEDERGNTVKNSFIINSETAAMFYMILPRSIEFNIDDIEVDVLAHKDDSVDLIDNKYISEINNGDFILNTIENQVVLKLNRDEKFNAKRRTGRITLEARYRDFIIADDAHKVGRLNKESGEYENVAKLPKFTLNLNIDWLYIFALCAESVHSVSDMETNEYGNFMHSWRFENKTFLGGDQYSIRIIADHNNKVPAVMLVDHFIDSGELSGAPLPTEGGSRMRIPLFKEHVRTLLKGLIEIAGEMDDYYWMKNFPVYSEEFEHTDKKMALGIKKIVHEERGDVVSFGLVGNPSEQIYLTDNDRDTLFFSTYYRLMYGRWLQFSGEQIAISSDGWLTDRYNEYKIEFDLESSSGASGSLPALAMLFAVARKRKNLYKKEG